MILGFVGRRMRLRHAIRAGRRISLSEEPFVHHCRAAVLETDERLIQAFSGFGIVPVKLRRAAAECVRRKIISGTMTRGLLAAFVMSAGGSPCPVAVALPPSWRRTIGVTHAMAFAEVESVMLWAGFVAKRLFAGLKTFVSLLRRSARALEANSGDYSVLCNVPSLAVTSASGIAAHDFLSWYRASRVRDARARRIWLNTTRVFSPVGDDVVAAAIPMPRLRPYARILWCLESFILIVVSALAAAVGRWRSAVILDELITLAWAKRLPPEKFACQYLFPQSDYVVRPLWTYIAQDAGSEILLVFYAINCELFGRRGQSTAIHLGYYRMDWPIYVVWDQRQAAFIRDVVPDARIVVDGAIAYQDNGAVFSPGQRVYLAVFDVTPIRTAMLSYMGLPQPYYRDREMRAFLSDIRTVAAKVGLTPVLKTKRRDSINRAPTAYRRIINEWADAADVAVAPPEIAAETIIDIAVATLSCPFSSTALVGQSRGRPSAYYDPSGELDPDHRLARDIPLLRGSSELEQWLRMVTQQPVPAEA